MDAFRVHAKVKGSYEIVRLLDQIVFCMASEC